MENKKSGELIYISAFVLWMCVMLLRLTYFHRWVPMGQFTNTVMYAVLALLLIRYVMNPDLSAGGILRLTGLLLFVFVAYSAGKLPFAVSLVLVVAGRDVSFEKLLRITLLLQSICFAVTVLCSQFGIIDDYMWTQYGRNRHGLGYTHCLLGSHFVLFMSLILVTLKKKMKLWLALFVLAMNYLMYTYTDARTTIILSVFFVVAALVAGGLEKVWKPKRWAALLSSFLPFSFFVVSLYSAKKFTRESETMLKINDILSGRLVMMNQAWNEYGISWFGQKIKWVGEANRMENPNQYYNYVDSAYLQAFFNYGIIFVCLLCLGWGLVMYRRMISGQYVMAVVILVVLIHGLINPQMIELVYNPFFLLLGSEFGNRMVRKR